jgi:hypothetical protein
MKINFLLKWWYKSDNLTNFVKSYRERNNDDSLDLSKDKIDTTVKAILTEILNNPRLGKPWSEDAMRRAIKSTLKEVIRNEKTELIAKAVNAIGELFPKVPTNPEIAKVPTAQGRGQELTNKALQLQLNNKKLKKLTIDELRLTILNCDTIAEKFSNEGFKIKKFPINGKKPVTVLIADSNRLSEVSKIINKEFEKAIKAKADFKKYLKNRYDYRYNEAEFFQTNFNRKKTIELDKSLISNLKKDLFENINENTIEKYILRHSPYLLRHRPISNFRFKINDLYLLTSPDHLGYTPERATECNQLVNRLEDKEIQQKLKTLTVIEHYTPALLKTFTENELAFIKLVNNHQF